MTVISRSLNRKAPIISSDLLISSPNPRVPFLPPCVEALSAEFLASLPLKPAGLRQKIYVLADNVCIALAGLVMEMQDILEDLERFCRYAPSLNAEVIRGYLREYDFSKYKGCAFFLMVIERDHEGMIHVMEIAMGEFIGLDSNMFDQSTAIGSGAGDFLNIIGQKMLSWTSFKDGDIRQSVVKHGGLIAHLLTLERATNNDLRNAWGGAFEFAVYDGRRFVKPINVAYVVNFAQIDSNGRYQMPVPVFVLHHRYEGEILIITKVFWKNHIMRDDEHDRLILTSDDVVAETFIAPPIKRGIEIPDSLFKPQSFETAWIGMGYLINTAEPDPFSIMPAFFTASVDLSVNFNAEEGKIEIFMREGMLPFLQEMVSSGIEAVRNI